MTVETDPKDTKETKEPKGGKEEGDMGDDWNEDRPITIGKSNLKFGPSKSKKSVRWKEETDLVDVYYFELDETERGKEFVLGFLYNLFSVFVDIDRRVTRSSNCYKFYFIGLTE